MMLVYAWTVWRQTTISMFRTYSTPNAPWHLDKNGRVSTTSTAEASQFAATRKLKHDTELKNDEKYAARKQSKSTIGKLMPSLP
jgi:hypothetical protein